MCGNGSKTYYTMLHVVHRYLIYQHPHNPYSMVLLKKKAQQRFTISDLGTIAIALVVAAVIMGMGATILEKIKSTQVVNGSAFNTTNFGLDGISVMAEFIPTIAIVAVAAIVIGIILVFFGRGRQ